MLVRHADAVDLSGTGRSYTQPIEAYLKKGNVTQAWRLFNETYTSKDCEALTEPSLGDVEQLETGKILLHVLNSVNASFLRGNKDLAPTAVLSKFEQLGFARPEHWTRVTLATLTHRAIQAGNGTPDGPQRDLPSLLSELLAVWRLFFQYKGGQNGQSVSNSTEWRLPAIDSLPDMFESRDFNMRLQEYHPKFVGGPTLGFCAIYLYSISDALSSIESLQQEAAPLLRFLERLLAGSNVKSILKHTETSYQFKALPQEVQQQIIGEINAAPKRAMVMVGTKGETLDPEQQGDESSNLEEHYLKRIARAIETRTAPTVLDSLWTQADKTYTSQEQAGTIPLRVYNAFLSGYLILHTPSRSVEVWNHMIAHGVKPDKESWVALLDGCAKAKDLNGLNATWTRMLSTGIEPDNYAWTARVNGLVSLRQINAGLAALDEMGKKWLAAENPIVATTKHGKPKVAKKPATKAVNKVTKPSIEVINGAISALVQISPGAMRHDKRVDFVQKILGWAGGFAIKPNVRTFNSLIQLYLRASDFATAFKVLRQMEIDGFVADIATHTMLVTASFDNQKMHDLSSAEQTERMISLFNDLEAAGLKLNDYIYSTAVDRLLREYSNHDAVKAIVEHMLARKLVPSAHIYTSLVTHYFQQSPPAIAAVDAVVHQLFTSIRSPSDRFLFDRLIEGYAEHAEVGKMMSVLTRMSKHGKQPGWSALTAVVTALVEAGDFERARLVVRDVDRGEGVAEGGVMGGKPLENKFLAVVKGFGLGLEEQRMGDFGQADWKIGNAGEGQGEGQEEVGERQGRMAQGEAYTAPGSWDLSAGAERGAVADVAEEEDVHGFLAPEPEGEVKSR